MVPVGKAPPANTATPGSSTAKARKPVLQSAQDTHSSQAVPPTRAEDTSDSSSSSDSDEEEAPKQPPKPGQFSPEDALGATRVGTAFCYPMGNVQWLERGSSSPAWQSTPLSLEASSLLVAVPVLGR